MKILTVRLQNLNSLKGEFTIAFDESPIKDSGLFLITGNTGAGKSTILDAITLALFGTVPRFEDMTVSKKENQIMTHGTMEAYAEVEFESAGEIYRSKWSLRKTRNDTFTDSKREIAKLSPDKKDSQILATKKKEVDTLVEELLGGLNFKRFTRSVLLAQGEFAEFLKGTQDRSTILERITNSDRYSKISIAAFERHKESLAELDRLNEQSSHVQLLSSEEKELLQEKLTSDNLLYAAQEKEVKTQQIQLQLIAKLEQLQSEKLKLTKQLEQDKTAQEHAKEAFHSLLKHQQALEFKPALDELELLQSKLETALVEIETLQKTTKTTLDKIAALKEEQEILLQNLTTTKEDFAAFEKIYDKVVQLDTQLESDKKTALALNKELETLTQLVDTKSKAIQSALQKKETLLKQQETTNTWLKEQEKYASLVGSDSLFELKGQYRDLQKHQKDLLAINKKQVTVTDKIKELISVETDLNKKAQQNETLLQQELIAYKEYCLEYKLDADTTHASLITTVQEQSSQAELFLQELKKVEEQQKLHQKTVTELIEVDEEIENKQMELEETDQLFLIQEELLDGIRKQEAYYDGIFNELKDKNSFSAFRGKLKEEEECPLCFSKEQPFRKLDVDISYVLKQAEVDFKKAKEKRQLIEKKYHDIIGAQRVLFAGIQDLQKNKTVIQQNLSKSEEATRAIIKSSNLNMASLVHQKEGLQEKMDDTTLLIKTYLSLEKKLDTIYQKIEYAQKDAKNIQTQLQQNALHLKDFAEQLEEGKVEVTHYNKNLTETQLAIQQQLAHYELDMDIPKAIELLEKQKDAYAEQLELQQEQKSKLEQIAVYVQSTTEQLEEATASKNLKKEAVDASKENLEALLKERKSLFGEDSIQDVKEQKNKALELLSLSLDSTKKQVQELENQQATNAGILSEKAKQQEQFRGLLDKKQPDLLLAIQSIGLENLEQLKASILDKKTAAEIALQQQELQQSIHLTQEKLDTIALQYEEFKQELTIDLEEKDSLLSAHQLLQEQLKELSESIGSTKEKLRQQQEQEKMHQALLKEIGHHKKEVNRWATLKEIIGSSDGKKFRVFAQSITLKKLIHLANQHLQYFINGRYYLEKRYGEYQDSRPDNILEIDIVDTFQANNKRPLNTLSGGESFLASLALALGLSDLAGGNATIESLFIDEGFGTLDSDTLQVAIRALQTLQSKGKTIGVISHIEQMKQCISTQIHVVKKGGGFSQVKVLEV